MRIERWLQLACSLATLWLVVGCGTKDDSSATGGGRSFGGPLGGRTSTASGAIGGAGMAFSNPSAPVGGAGGTPVINQNEVTCGRGDIFASRIMPSVMLVVDGSQSMAMMYGDAPDAGVTDAGMAGGGMPGGGGTAPGGTSRWSAVRQALIDPTNGVVPKLQSQVKFGLAVFGTMPTCPLPNGVVDPALNNLPMIMSGLPTNPPGFTTPTGPALDMIVDRLPDPSMPLDMTVGPQIVVLATDGDPNSCGNTDPLGALLGGGGVMTDYAPSIAAAMKLAAKHLHMYVISVGKDAAMQHLQEMANLGAGLAQNANPGATVYYPENPQALADTLAMLIGKEIPCDVALSGKGVMMGFECLGKVTINGNELPCNGADGWVLKDPTHITLQGAACDMLKNATDAMLHAEFPCKALLD